MITVKFGLGETRSNWGKSNGKPAVILEPISPSGPVGHEAPGSNDDPLHPETVVLEFHAPEGAEVLVDDIRLALVGAGVPVPDSIAGTGPLFKSAKEIS
jgi:hypothetical protein